MKKLDKNVLLPNQMYLTAFGVRDFKPIDEGLIDTFQISEKIGIVGSGARSTREEYDNLIPRPYLSTSLVRYLDLKNKKKVSVAETVEGNVLVAVDDDENIRYAIIRDGRILSTSVNKLSERSSGIGLTSDSFSSFHLAGVIFESLVYLGVEEVVETYEKVMEGSRENADVSGNLIKLSDSVMIHGLEYVDMPDTSTVPDFDYKEVEIKEILTDGLRLFTKVVMESKLDKDFIGRYDVGFKPNKAEKMNIEANIKEIKEKGYVADEVSEMLAKEFYVNNDSFLHLYRGISGSGKSVSTKIIAAMLNLPHYVFSTSPDTDSGDLLGRYSPNPNRISDEMVEDFPSEVYMLLTGNFYNEKEDKFDLLKEVSQKNGEFVFTESAIVQTFRNGGVCELQEVNIASPETFVALNRAFEEGKMYLQSGEVIERHPQSLFIKTINPEYLGTYDLQESTLSRVVGVFDFDNPSIEVSVARICSELKIKEEPILFEMAEMVAELTSLLVDRNMAGVVDYRSFKNWVQAHIVHDNMYECLVTRVVNKMSSNKDDLSEAIEHIKMSKFMNKRSHKFTVIEDENKGKDN